MKSSSLSPQWSQLIISCLAVMAIASTAIAQPPGGPGGPPQDPLAELLDTNKDGEISTAEMKKIVEILKKMDKNKDGELTGDELPRPPRGPGGPGGRGGGRRETKLVAQFDADKNGWLNREERTKARAFKESQGGGRGGRTRGGGGRGRGGRGGPGGNSAPASPGRELSPGDIKNHVGTPLYDANVLRTFFIEFEHDDWEKEMAAFYRTDVYVPATVTVDGKKYPSVGVSFRGNSSFFTVGEGQKRSLNLTMDLIDDKQNLLGYRTLNLLNGHMDASFLREVLYNHIARNYIPAPKANFVHVVINGRSWGIYINAQQMNKDFVEEWFGSRSGARWKIPAGGGGGRSMNFVGNDAAAYSSYELKSKADPEATKRLIEVCEKLDKLPVDKLDSILDEHLNVDRVLWFLALDNVLSDRDGYHSRGSDYAIYQDTNFNRLHVLPYDSNETFLPAGGGGGPGRGRGGFGGGFGGRGGRGGPGGAGGRPGGTGGRPDGAGGRPGGGAAGGANAGPYGLNPFQGENSDNLPLLSRLLKNERLRARYVAHVRTLTREWLNWDQVGPVVMHYHELIAPEVKKDTRKLYTTIAFANSLDQEPEGRTSPGLRRFIQGRAAHLNKLPELKAAAPKILSTSHQSNVAKGELHITAKVAKSVSPSTVIAYVSSGRNAPFKSYLMEPIESGKGHTFGAKIPVGKSQELKYYVEARSKSDKQLTVSFHPSNTEVGAIPVAVAPQAAAKRSVVISEVMPANLSSTKDPQGGYDDWLKLHNQGAKPVDLSGHFLSDSAKSLKKWSIPKGTVLKPGATLVIWADNDLKASGLHANFRLDRKGETIFLVSPKGEVLSQLTWKQASQNQALRRSGESAIAK